MVSPSLRKPAPPQIRRAVFVIDATNLCEPSRRPRHSDEQPEKPCAGGLHAVGETTDGRFVTACGLFTDAMPEGLPSVEVALHSVTGNHLHLCWNCVKTNDPMYAFR